MICPNCGENANFTEHRAGHETRVAVFLPIESIRLVCDECGALTNHRELSLTQLGPHWGIHTCTCGHDKEEHTGGPCALIDCPCTMFVDADRSRDDDSCQDEDSDDDRHFPQFEQEEAAWPTCGEALVLAGLEFEVEEEQW